MSTKTNDPIISYSVNLPLTVMIKCRKIAEREGVSLAKVIRAIVVKATESEKL